MAFSVLWQFAYGDEPGLQRWLLEHYLEHQTFYRTLLEQSPTVQTVNYPIQRMESPQDWLAAHDRMSQAVWSALGGGQSTDLGTLDWKDERKVQDWMYDHALWHERVRGLMGL